MCLAVPGKLLNFTNSDSLTRSGRVDFGGMIREVNLTLVPEVDCGDYVIVHAGIALSILDVDEAVRVFDIIKQIDSSSGVKDT